MKEGIGDHSGLKSRFNRQAEFPDCTAEKLSAVSRLHVRKTGCMQPGDGGAAGRGGGSKDGRSGRSWRHWCRRHRDGVKVGREDLEAERGGKDKNNRNKAKKRLH